ncbi:MAG: HIT domain-containing protein [Acidimicrobiia bacterium]
MLERLWAGWRSAYLDTIDDGAPASGAPPADDGRSLFEAILASGRPDDETLIVWRGETCFALLNLYPYTSGHVLVLPNRAVEHLEDLDDETADELWRTVRRAVVAVKAAYHPEGVNVGANLGRAAGAGIPDHLHVHVLPRWSGDTNFTTTIAETRVVPEPLDVTWRKITQAWPR